MRTLLIDNYDSFTFNLFQLLAEVNGREPVVVRNDEATWSQLARLGFDNVVVSPGPGRPERAGDFGVCADAIRAAEVPLLGVCLGHQGLGSVFGATVGHAPEVVHGRLSPISHSGAGLFAGIPQGFQAVRYHSLCVVPPLPDCLEATAWAPDGTIMGLRHRSRPSLGIQFHPESICTSFGRRLLENFRELTERAQAAGGRGRRRRVDAPAPPPERPAAAGDALRLEVCRLEVAVDAERCFVHLYGDDPHAFWLDSSRRADARSRFSFLGGSSGPRAAVVRYDVARQEVSVTRNGSTRRFRETIFDYLRRELDRMRPEAEPLPFDFDAGFVGYLGYELKADCGGSLAHRSPLPDAAFLLADRLVAVDHVEGTTYLLCLTDRATERDGRAWIERTRRQLETLPALEAPPGRTAAVRAERPLRLSLARGHDRYVDDVRRCKEHLFEGETYEVCLTNKVRADVAPDPLELYRVVRRVNPAPFSAFLRVGEAAVISSSPERFLRVQRDRWVETRPVKGTAPRGRTQVEDRRLREALRTDEKNRAENLIVTDLLRNDLGRVCEIGSVHVPGLIEVETYETVHQLVSTIRGRLREGLGATDCVRACFPGGSMTGAPKRRTMEIIDELEGEARGVYSGAIGYFGLCGGADLNIVIRTIVLDGRSASIGTGGAIVMRSEPEEEYRETVLKAEALVRSLRLYAGAASVTAEHSPELEPQRSAT